MRKLLVVCLLVALLALLTLWGCSTTALANIPTVNRHGAVVAIAPAPSMDLAPIRGSPFETIMVTSGYANDADYCEGTAIVVPKARTGPLELVVGSTGESITTESRSYGKGTSPALADYRPTGNQTIRLYYHLAAT